MNYVHTRKRRIIIVTETINVFLVRDESTKREWLVIARNDYDAISKVYAADKTKGDLTAHYMQDDRAYVVKYGERLFVKGGEI